MRWRQINDNPVASVGMVRAHSLRRQFRHQRQSQSLQMPNPNVLRTICGRLSLPAFTRCSYCCVPSALDRCESLRS